MSLSDCFLPTSGRCHRQQKRIAHRCQFKRTLRVGTKLSSLKDNSLLLLRLRLSCPERRLRSKHPRLRTFYEIGLFQRSTYTAFKKLVGERFYCVQLKLIGALSSAWRIGSAIMVERRQTLLATFFLAVKDV